MQGSHVVMATSSAQCSPASKSFQALPTQFSNTFARYLQRQLLACTIKQVQMLTSAATAESAWHTAIALAVVPAVLLSELRKSNLPTTNTGLSPAYPRQLTHLILSVFILVIYLM